MPSVLKQFHAKKKPIGLCCIAPVLAARVIPNAKVTIGRDAATAEVCLDDAKMMELDRDYLSRQVFFL